MRGFRLIEPEEMVKRNDIVWDFRRFFAHGYGFEEVGLPSVCERTMFEGKTKDNRLWDFKDKGGRDVCLAPEGTAILQEQWENHWSKTQKSKRVLYISDFFRYERPQRGRYRQFTQLGVEVFGEDNLNIEALLQRFLDSFKGLSYEFNNNVDRGWSYYRKGKGFEASVPSLGAQKQIAGGGQYSNGKGFAIGLDRLILAVAQ